MNYAVYLLGPDDGSMLTALNSTHGMERAYEKLSSSVKRMRSLRGTRVVPIVELDSAVMPTKYGAKLRPEFRIVDWVLLGGEAPQQVASLDANVELPAQYRLRCNGRQRGSVSLR